MFCLQLRGTVSFFEMMEAIGHIPLPPYIKRDDTQDDRSTYQTVYASKAGAVAAPTAGLHFDDGILEALRSKGVQIAFVTLHVGAGTFVPVQTDTIAEHTMHAEYAHISQEVCDLVNKTKAGGGRVVAVGTDMPVAGQTQQYGSRHNQRPQPGKCRKGHCKGCCRTTGPLCASSYLGFKKSRLFSSLQASLQPS
jgi:S-adenosylmethionine:tRNA ribosyltransferase-isomerase